MTTKALYTFAVVWGLFAVALFAQTPAAPQPMSFFVTSVGIGDGGNLAGIVGADFHCQKLAQAVGSTKTFRAYLSVQSFTGGMVAVNARDRIGTGPWYNANGQLIARNVAELHGDTLEQARLGNALGKQTALTEKKEIVKGLGDTPNIHDILTGSTPDGRAFPDKMDHTCYNWTRNTIGSAQVGHSDRNGGGNSSWNSSHASRGCSQTDLVGTGGAGLLYCFAID
jgi:hypothetical protein